MTIYNGWIHWQSTGTSHRERQTGIKYRASLRKNFPKELNLNLIKLLDINTNAQEL